MVKKRTSEGTISYHGDVTMTGDRKFVEGEPKTVSIKCRFEPTDGKIVTLPDGSEYKVSGIFFADPFADEIPPMAVLTVNGKDYKIAGLYKYHKYVEIWV